MLKSKTPLLDDIANRARAAQERWDKLRKQEMPEFWGEGYMTQSRHYDRLLRSDAELEVWHYTHSIAENAREKMGEEHAIESVKRLAARQIQSYRGHHSTSAMTNIIEEHKHFVWLEVHELVNPSW